MKFGEKWRNATFLVYTARKAVFTRKFYAVYIVPYNYTRYRSEFQYFFHNAQKVVNYVKKWAKAMKDFDKISPIGQKSLTFLFLSNIITL